MSVVKPSAPKPKNQGSSGSAPTQKTSIQGKSGPAKPGPSVIKYTSQPRGIGGSGKGAK